MEQYTMQTSGQFEAIQFLNEENRPNMIKHCVVLYDGETVELSNKLLGSVKGSFFAIKNGQKWDNINLGDWIVKKDDLYVAVPNGLFKLLFNKTT